MPGPRGMGSSREREVVHLLGHHSLITHDEPEYGFVQDYPPVQGHLPVKDALALHTGVDHALDLLVGVRSSVARWIAVA
ncbi:hypothetical protein GWI24_37205 [Streptomyces sp. MK37H]|nr:hypothetical protein [Streptomyces sp. MK37H]MBP8538604.1 hypothetical protein [Streptomyces sp. MK37H]